MGITIWNYNELYKLSRNISTIFRQRGSKTKLQQKKLSLNYHEKYTISILIAMVAFLANGMVTRFGNCNCNYNRSIFINFTKLGCDEWKESLKGVSWNLILFVGRQLH